MYLDEKGPFFTLTMTMHHNWISQPDTFRRTLTVFKNNLAQIQGQQLTLNGLCSEEYLKELVTVCNLCPLVATF